MQDPTVTPAPTGITHDRALALVRRGLLNSWFPHGLPEDLSEWERVADMDARAILKTLAGLGVLDTTEVHYDGR